MKNLLNNLYVKWFLIINCIILVTLCVTFFVNYSSAVNLGKSYMQSLVMDTTNINTSSKSEFSQLDTETVDTASIGMTTVDASTASLPDFNQFDKLPNTHLWTSGHKHFTDNGKYWQIDVEVTGNQVIIKTMPGMNNASHSNKKEITSTETGTIVDNAIISSTPSSSKIKNAFRYLNGEFYIANNEGQYDKYEPVTIAGNSGDNSVSAFPNLLGKVPVSDFPVNDVFTGRKYFTNDKGLYKYEFQITDDGTININLTYGDSNPEKSNSVGSVVIQTYKGTLQNHEFVINQNGKLKRNVFRLINNVLLVLDDGAYEQYDEYHRRN